jgi:hypothetical protein
MAALEKTEKNFKSGTVPEKGLRPSPGITSVDKNLDAQSQYSEVKSGLLSYKKPKLNPG